MGVVEYVYLLQEREFRNANQNIYKIGKTKTPNLCRFKKYPKDSKLILHAECPNCDEAEKNIIKLFDEKYKNRKDIGREYYEGCKISMYKDIFEISYRYLETDYKKKVAEEERQNKELQSNVLSIIERDDLPLSESDKDKFKLFINDLDKKVVEVKKDNADKKEEERNERLNGYKFMININTIIIKLQNDDKEYKYPGFNTIPDEYFNKIIYLNCSYNKLTKIPKFPNLEELRCFSNNLTILPEYPNLQKLDCSDNLIKTLPEYPNLKELNCSYNNLTSLQKYPNLQKLYCSNNELISLPEYPNLIKLNIESNNLISLQEYHNLEELLCSNNKLSSLPEYPNLKELFCSNNKIKSLPKYPNLQELFCSLNELISLTEYPNLQILQCYNNQLVSLPEYPNLQDLSCSNNKLKSLSKYPNLQYRLHF